MEPYELNQLGLCGMMHDMGKMYIPPEILNKPGKLTNEEMDIMKTHSARGWKLLVNTSGMYLGAADVAYMHHERIDGKGYPRNLSAEQTTPYSKMVAIVDLYDAVSSNRVYRKGLSHLDSIKILHEASDNGQMDPALTMKFIECLGIYPAGSVVELTSGEVALVLEVNPKAKLKPRILIVRDSDKVPCNEYEIDLAMISVNPITQRSYGIKNILRPEDCDINLLDYYNNGLFDRNLEVRQYA